MSNASQIKALSGTVLLNTRAAHQALELTVELEQRGARIFSLPTIEIVKYEDTSVLRNALAEIDSFSWTVFTSVNAVNYFFDGLKELNLDGSLLNGGGRLVSAVGIATERALTERGIEVALVPEDARAEGLIEVFGELIKAGKLSGGARILMPRALVAREIFQEFMRGYSIEVVVAPVYETRARKFEQEDIEAALGTLSAAIFTSPSTSRSFFNSLERLGIEPAALFASGMPLYFSIGPVTTAALLELGITKDLIVESPTFHVKALAKTIEDRLSKAN